jgi:hypothetical protein
VVLALEDHTRRNIGRNYSNPTDDVTVFVRWNTVQDKLGDPGVWDRSLVAFPCSHQVKMEGGQVFQRGVEDLHDPCVNGFDVLVAFFAEINPIQLFPFCLKELE